MSDAGKYYSMMLGLDGQTEPTDHYQLLGLARFEDGERAIRNAALDRHRKLLHWEHSAHHEAAAALMDEVAHAKEILLDLESKREYDRQLGRAPQAADGDANRRRREIETARQRVAFLREDDRPDEALRILSTIVSEKRPEFQADVEWARQTQQEIQQAVAGKQKADDEFIPLVPLPEEELIPPRASAPAPARRRLSLAELAIPPSVIEMVPESVAREMVVIPLRLNGKALVVAFAAPEKDEAVDKLRFILNCEIDVRAAPEDEIQAAIDRHYGQSAPALDVPVESLRAVCNQHAHADFHAGSKIPREKLANAQQSYGILLGEEVLAIVDATFIGDATDGLAICDTGIYWHNRDEPSGFISWLEFARARLEVEDPSRIRMGEAGACNLLTSACEPEWLLALLRQLQRVLQKPERILQKPQAAPAPPPAAPVASPQQATGSARQPVVVAKALAFCLQQRSKGYYAAASIPAARLRNARKAYRIPAAAVCLGLIDCTVFGSAKNGLAVCTTGLYWKNQMGAPQYLAWELFSVAPLTPVGSYDIGFGTNGALGRFTTAGSPCGREWILNFLRGLQQQIAGA